jgi:RNA polymerase sigma factor for flagellar operon FliA
MTQTAAPPLVPLSFREQDMLVREHLPLVGHLVRQAMGRLPAHVSREDLVSAGMAALAGSARAFDPSRGIPFGSFATNRIRGAVLDELRGQDWASRSVRAQARKVDTAAEQLTGTLGRPPTQSELAKALEVTLEELAALQGDVQRASVLSLQGFATGSAEEMLPEPAAGPEELLLYRERVGYLHSAIEALPARLRAVVTGYFFQERPMVDIAADLGVTESRVSQMRAEALTLLREGLHQALEPDKQAPPARRPSTFVARRREQFHAQIAEQGSLRSRLAHTNHHGMPFAQARRHS